MGILSKSKRNRRNSKGIPILDPETAHRSAADGMRKSGMDISFGTIMKWMHTRDKEGTDKISSLAIDEVISTIESTFPGALPVQRMAEAANKLLAKHGGFTKGNTILATSLCCDELNRDLEAEFARVHGPAYNMGGLAGFAFGGVVGFGNMLHHAPGDGNCIVVYGPHVGCDMDGTIGKVNRKGLRGSSECCGPALVAMQYCHQVRRGERAEIGIPEDISESEQAWVCRELMPYMDNIESASDPAVELANSLFDSQDAIMKRMMSKAGQQLNPVASIGFLGGITINTPEGTPDFFLPKKFVIVDGLGNVKKDLSVHLSAAEAPFWRRNGP